MDWVNNRSVFKEAFLPEIDVCLGHIKNTESIYGGGSETCKNVLTNDL